MLLFPLDPRFRRARWLLALASLGPGLWMGSQILPMVWHFGVDDALITYAYARHLAAGDGLVASVGGPTVEGFSNPTWTLLLAAIEGLDLGLALHRTAQALGVALAAITALLGAAATPLLEGRARDRLWTYGVPLAYMVLCPPIMVWAVGGLEGPLYSLVLLLAVLLDVRDRRYPARSPLSAYALLLVCASRPEGMVYALGFVALRCFDGLRHRSRRRQLGLFLLTFFGLFLLCLSLRWWIFDDLVPNTYYPKLFEDRALRLSRGWSYVVRNEEAHHFLYFLPLALLGTPRKARTAIVLWAIPIGSFVFAIYSGGDWMPGARFLAYGLPIYGLLIHLGLRRGLRLARLWPARLPGQLLACAAMVGLMLWPSERTEAAMDYYRSFERTRWCMICDTLELERRVAGIAEELELPMWSEVNFDYGAPAFRSSPARLAYDLGGLCDRTAGQSPRLPGETWDYGPTHAYLRIRQHFLHEQHRAPTFLAFKQQWWAWLDEISEHRLGYYRWRGPLWSKVPSFRVSLRRDLFLDDFPRHRRFSFQRLGAGVRLLGATLEEEGQVRRLTLSLLRGERLPARGTELELRAIGAQEPLASTPLFGDQAALMTQWQLGEPLLIELPLGSRPAQELQIALVEPGREPIRVAIHPGAPDRAPWLFERSARNLPAAIDPALLTLRDEVFELWTLRERRADYRVQNPALGERLREIGEGLLEEGEREQAYLAFVWARSVDLSLDGPLVDELIHLRGTPSNHRYVMELSLLRAYYRSASASDGARLAAFYLELGEDQRARYFLDRLPRSPALTPLRELLQQPPQRRAQVPGIHRPQELEPDFEEGSRRGWRATREASEASEATFSVLDPDQTRFPFTGHRGRRALVSADPGAHDWAEAARARGSLISAPFRARGRRLSFLLGGFGREAKVELLHEGRVVREARTRLLRDLQPIFWEIREFEGQPLQLRLVDPSATSALVFDDLRMWD